MLLPRYLVIVEKKLRTSSTCGMTLSKKTFHNSDGSRSNPIVLLYCCF